MGRKEGEEEEEKERKKERRRKGERGSKGGRILNFEHQLITDNGLTVGVLPSWWLIPWALMGGRGRGLGAMGPWILINIRNFSARSGFSELCVRVSVCVCVCVCVCVSECVCECVHVCV